MISLNNVLYKKPNRQLKRRTSLTCVIGAKCAEGCVIVSDTRVLREFEANNESKINKLWDKVVSAGEGNTAILDNFSAELAKSKLPSTPDFGKVVKTIEDIAHVLQARYRPRIGMDYEFQALVMGLKNFDKGDPYLRRVYGEGISEEVKDFAIIGHGAPYVTPFFKLLYDRMLSVNELAVLGYFVISTIVFLGLDQTVGFGQYGPEAVVLKPNEEPLFLNPLSKEFSTARDSLSSLKFRFKLIKSIWTEIPQAYENVDPSLY
jgi:20S proteasome alpha/beta subunit